MSIGVLYAFGMALCWAASGISLQRPSRRMDVFMVSGVRAIAGMVFLLPMVLVGGLIDQYALLTGRQIIFLVGSLVAGGVIGDICYVLALRALGMSRCFPIMNAYPLFTVLYGLVLLGTPVSARTLAGAVLVLLGVYFIARSMSRESAGAVASLPRATAVRGVGLALAAAAAYGLESILISMGVGDVNGIVANSVRVPVVAVFGLSVAWARGALAERRGVDARTIGLVALAGLLGWALAGSMWVASIQTIGAAKAAIIGSTSPLFAVPLSMVILGERPTIRTLVGTVLTVAGIVLVL